MIQTRTALCVIAAVASGLFLYTEKRQALMIDREISGLMRATADLHTRTALLRVEWASMLGPDQLLSMVSEHLMLQPIAPAQFVQLSELGAHLPKPGTYKADASPSDDDTAIAPDDPGNRTVQTDTVPIPDPVKPAEPGVLANAASPRLAQHGPAIASAGTLQTAFVMAPKRLQKPVVRPILAQHNPAQHSQAQHSVAQHSLALAGGPNRPFALQRPVLSLYKIDGRPAHATDTALSAAAPGRELLHPNVESALGSGIALPPPLPYRGAGN